MFQVSPKAKKISLISVFSLMLAVIVGLSVALGIVCNKDKEQWDVVTDEYAYKVIYVPDQDYPLVANAYIKIKNFTSKYTSYIFDIRIYNKTDNSLVCGYTANGDLTYKNFITISGPSNYLPPNEATLIPVYFMSGSINGLIVDPEINFRNCYCLISNFKIDKIENKPNSY